MIKEKSCGAVIYKIIDNQVYFLVEKMQRGHYALTKGHVENNETEVETATREIKEETNLDVIIDILSPTRAFINVDLPTLGFPTIFTKPALCILIKLRVQR